MTEQRSPLSAAALRGLRAVAARHARVEHEIDDVVQDILLAAIAEGRSLADPTFMAWASGAVRLHSRFLARTAGRRQRRERAFAAPRPIRQEPLRRLPRTFVDSLPPGRRLLALLINLGMGRQEIAYLLGITDVAMRQRLAGLRKAMADADIRPTFAMERQADSPDGLLRRALKSSLPPRPVRQFAVRDPDGLTILISGDHVSAPRGNKGT
jgi:DNA-directed RNA polymerase specialized sigma24 family protein